MHSWVSFIPPAFETTILFAAFTAVIAMIALNGLPQPYHPVFNARALQPARARTSSSSPSRRPTRSSTPAGRGSFSRAWARERWWKLRTEE